MTSSWHKPHVHEYEVGETVVPIAAARCMWTRSSLQWWWWALLEDPMVEHAGHRELWAVESKIGQRHLSAKSGGIYFKLHFLAIGCLAWQTFRVCRPCSHVGLGARSNIWHLLVRCDSICCMGWICVPLLRVPKIDYSQIIPIGWWMQAKPTALWTKSRWAQ